MSELRAVALERHGSGIEATQADAEMEAERFRLLHQINTRCGDRAVNVRIYEQRPLTAEERLEKVIKAGEQLLSALTNATMHYHGCSRELVDEVMAAWGEAVTCEAASTQREVENASLTDSRDVL